MPLDLAQKIKTEAAKERRSENEQIVKILEDHYHKTEIPINSTQQSFAGALAE
jgi:hypothetical protein